MAFLDHTPADTIRHVDNYSETQRDCNTRVALHTEIIFAVRPIVRTANLNRALFNQEEKIVNSSIKFRTMPLDPLALSIFPITNNNSMQVLLKSIDR